LIRHGVSTTDVLVLAEGCSVWVALSGEVCCGHHLLLLLLLRPGDHLLRDCASIDEILAVVRGRRDEPHHSLVGHHFLHHGVSLRVAELLRWGLAERVVDRRVAHRGQINVQWCVQNTGRSVQRLELGMTLLLEASCVDTRARSCTRHWRNCSSSGKRSRVADHRRRNRS